jgi:hypothetical protein
LGILAADEVEATGSSTNPPVTAGNADDGLQDESDDWVGEMVHVKWLPSAKALAAQKMSLKLNTEALQKQEPLEGFQAEQMFAQKKQRQ